MGRRTYPIRGPRTSLVSDREIERAMSKGGMPSFGIRRPVGPELAREIADRALDMQAEGRIPPEKRLRIRDVDLGVTLLSRRVIGAQIQRGRLQGYNLGVARAQIIRSDECGERGQPITEIKRGEVKVFQGRVVYAEVHHEDLEREIDGIHSALAIAGLRGVARREKPFVPHLTLGEVAGYRGFSREEQTVMIEAYEQELPETFGVEGWETYPFDIFDQSAP
jgi:hypothetical protein